MFRLTLVALAAFGAFALVLDGRSAYAGPKDDFIKACKDDGKIDLPMALPRPFTCTDKNNAGCKVKNAAGTEIEWKPIGRFEATADANNALVPAVQSSGSAQFFAWTSGKTTCWYFYRRFDTGRTANGVLCFNTDTCSVCALDVGYTGAPKWDKLKTANQFGTAVAEQCWKCHAAGSIAPLENFYKSVKGTTLAINQTCAAQGGPNWIKPPAAWTDQKAVWDNQNKKDRHKDPPKDGGCAGGNCHANGFVQGKPKGAPWFCAAAVKPAFKSGGAMEGNWPGKAVCHDFAQAMGCTDEQIGGCPSE